jgi:hypothetical protein
MPIVDRREFGGRFTVNENSRRLANYRYLEIQLMEMLGGWCMTTPQLAFKATFGYHVYDHAQAGDLLGERLEQLRSWGNRQEPPNDDFARLCEYVWNLDSQINRLAAVYRVLEPHLVSTYVYHAEATDPLADSPTTRLLRQLAGTGQSHVAWGHMVLDSLTDTPEKRKEALEVQADLEARLVACGGVTGKGIETHWLTFHSAKTTEKTARTRQHRKSGAYTFAKQAPSLPHPVVEEPFWFSDKREDFKKVYDTEDEWSIEGFRHKFHQLLYGEVETTDRMGKMIAEYPNLPWEMRMELANQMWDEARHIEIVAKACEEELGATLGYGPWPLVWWWMQNETDPLRRIAVTNGWAESNLMSTLRQWREKAEERGYPRIVELADYLQADEMNHVKLVNRWLRDLTEGDLYKRAEVVEWGRDVVHRIEAFYSDDPHSVIQKNKVKFSFLKSNEDEELEKLR